MTGRGSHRGTCALFIALTPAMATAADWSVQSSAQVYLLAESNPRLLVDNGMDAQSGVVDLSLDLLRRTELLDLDLNAQGIVHRYSEDDGLNREDQHVAVAFTHRGELHSLQGNATLTRDTTLTSELGTTGITRDNLRHRARGLSLAPKWQLTERLSTGLTLGWQDSSYGRHPQGGLSNYNYSYAGFDAALDVSERSSASLSVSAGRLDSALYTFNTNSRDMRLQLQHVWSPRWRGSVSGGLSRVQTEARRSSGSIFGASVARQGEALALGLSITRSNTPTGSGLLSRRDEAGLHADVTLSDYVTAAASVSAVRSKELIPAIGVTASDVRYLHAELSLSWRLAPDWSLGLGAGNSGQKQLNGGATGKSFDARMLLAWHRNSG